MHVVTRMPARMCPKSKELTCLRSIDAAFKRTNLNFLAADNQLPQGDGSKDTYQRLSPETDPLNR